MEWKVLQDRSELIFCVCCLFADASIPPEQQATVRPGDAHHVRLSAQHGTLLPREQEVCAQVRFQHHRSFILASRSWCSACYAVADFLSKGLWA